MVSTVVCYSRLSPAANGVRWIWSWCLWLKYCWGNFQHWYFPRRKRHLRWLATNHFSFVSLRMNSLLFFLHLQSYGMISQKIWCSYYAFLSSTKFVSTQLISSFLLDRCFHNLNGFLFMDPGSWLHSIHFLTLLVTHIHVDYEQIIFSSWLVIWLYLSTTGLWFWGFCFCISFLPMRIGGKTSMGYPNHGF